MTKRCLRMSDYLIGKGPTPNRLSGAGTSPRTPIRGRNPGAGRGYPPPKFIVPAPTSVTPNPKLSFRRRPEPRTRRGYLPPVILNSPARSPQTVIPAHAGIQQLS